MKKRFLRLLTASLILGVGFMSLTGCVDNNEEIDEEVTLESIAVTTPPTKTTYTEGESFDKTGMVVIGTYSDESTETISNVRISVSPSILNVGDTYVTLTYEGLSTTTPVTVNEIVITDLTLTSFPVSTTYATSGTYDFSGLEVTATLEDGSTKTVSSSEYTLSINETVIEDGEEITLSAGTYTVDVSYKDKTVSFDITLIVGYLIEAEDIAFSDPEDLEPYVRIKMNESSEYLTEPNSSGSIRAIDDETAAQASGTGYLGDINRGNIIDFYFYSEINSTAEISIRAASGYMIESTNDNTSWTPVAMGDAPLNQLLTATINGEVVTITDDVILEGGRTEDTVNGDMGLWTNWKEVPFGTITTIEGWNVVSITVTSELQNCLGQNCSFNLDYLAVDFQE